MPGINVIELPVGAVNIVARLVKTSIGDLQLEFRNLDEAGSNWEPVLIIRKNYVDGEEVEGAVIQRFPSRPGNLGLELDEQGRIEDVPYV